MRRRRHIAVTVGLALVALLVAASVAWTLRTPLLSVLPIPPVVVTGAEYGRVITLDQGQRLEVQLPSNRKSGSTWQVSIPLSFLHQESQSAFVESAMPAHPGDGYQSIVFRAVAKGSGPLFLSYLPIANQNSLTPSRSFRVVVEVR
jgi:predicted secreted protein